MSSQEEEKMEMGDDENDKLDDDGSSDDDDDLSNEKEQEIRANIKQLRIQLTNNALFYDGHVNLISSLRELAELEEARHARDAMNVVYPLSPELWLEWVRDEQKVCTNKQERDYIVTLFDRAVQDYMSVQIWVEYIMFMLGGGDMEATRAVGDRALTAVGTHVAEGILVWQVVLLVEKQIYAGMQKPGSVESEEDTKNKGKQLNRIQNLFRRQSRVPLLNVDCQEFLAEALEYFTDDIDSHMKKDLEKTQQKLNEKLPFEDELLQCDDVTEKLAIYRRYISHSKETDNPSAVQNLYERAITDNCLDASLWEEYLCYALRQFQGLDYVILPLCKRSQRNCPWSASLCSLHIRALQLYSQDFTNIHDKIKGALEVGLNCGLQSGVEATRMWMAYLVYLRRMIDWEKDHETPLENLTKMCQEAIDSIDNSFGHEGDIESEIPRFWARLEAESAKNIERAREIWNDIIMKRNNNFKSVTLWLEFINLERSYGTQKHCRKLFRRALERVWDQVELIGDAQLRYEQEIGTLDTMEEFLRRYEDRMIIVKRKRQEDEAKLELEKQTEESQSGRSFAKGSKFHMKKMPYDKYSNGKTQQASNFKTPHPLPKKKGKGFNEDGTRDLKNPAPGFKNKPETPPRYKEDINAPPGYKKDIDAPPGFKKDADAPPSFKDIDVNAPPGYKKDIDTPPGYTKDNEDIEPPPGFKRKAEDSEDESKSKKVKVAEQYGLLTDKDSNDDLATAFISNLEFSIDKEEIIPLFSQFGEIKEFRLVRDFKKRSKGFGYLVFKTQQGLREALKHDRIPLNGRPVYVSEYDPEGQTHHFKFPTKLEKNKLFIRGLPFDMNQEDIKKEFSSHGEIKDIRLVSYRNGFSKGTCYIEYNDDETAEKVRKATDGLELKGKVINVMISNPPSKNNPISLMPVSKGPTLGGGSKTKLGAKKKGMFDLMPRSLMRNSASSSTSTKTTEVATDVPEKPKSNEDFRKMLLK